MTDQKIYITVGTSSSGKSTWARKMAKEKGWKIVDGDSLRKMTFGKCVYSLEVEPILKDMALHLAVRWFQNGYSVVIDDAVWFLSKQDRGEVFYTLWPHESIIWVCFPIPSDGEVIERRMLDRRGISLEQWKEIKHQHEQLIQFPDPRNENCIYHTGYYPVGIDLSCNFYHKSYYVDHEDCIGKETS